MKKILSVALSLILMINIFIPFTAYSNDTSENTAVWGENDNYDISWLGEYDLTANYYIRDALDLAAFKKACYIDGKNFQGKTVSLLNDIDLSDYYWLTFSVHSDENKCFSGVFNGNGYTISGVKMLPTSTFYADTAGLFPFIRNACVKDLNVRCDARYSNVAIIGGLCGLAADSAVYNCSSESNIVCEGSNGVYMTGYVGGLIGKADHCAIINCFSDSDIYAANIVPDDSSVHSTGEMCIGGLIGWLSSESDEEYCLLNSFSIGKVYAETNFFMLSIGGLLGKAEDDIVNCYSACDVSGKGYKYIGSIVGEISFTKLDNNLNIVGDYIVESLYYESIAPFGNADETKAVKVTSKDELCKLLNLNTTKVDKVIKEHRDILSNSSWADLVLACSADSFTAKSWQIYYDVAGGYPSFYHSSNSKSLSKSEELVVPSDVTSVLKINRPVIKKIKHKNKTAKIYWKKVSSVSGYQIQISSNKNFKDSKTKTATVKSNKNLYKTFKVSNNKKYYVIIDNRR